MGLKLIFLLCFLMFSLSFVTAVLDLEIEEKVETRVVISELGNPASYNFVIDNNGESDFVEIYSLVGVSFSPKGTFEIPSGRKSFEIIAYVSDELKERPGVYSIEYQMKGNQGIFRDTLPLTVVSLEDVFSVRVENINPNDLEGMVFIKNNFDVDLEGVELGLESAFFDLTEEFDLEGGEEINYSVGIDREKTSKLLAGPYVIDGDIEVGGVRIGVEGVINYLEKEGTSVSKAGSGFLIREVEVIKINEGNVPVSAKIEMKKDIISRLFTTYSEEPHSVERKGIVVNYVWEKELGPGESHKINARTNYTLPFIVLVLIVLIVILVKFYSSKALSFKKSVSLVKTRGGEFALKVRLSVKARKNVKGVDVVDRLPGMTKLYEKYGRKPDKIDEKTRRISWSVEGLNRGEERVFSYIIYSKVRAVGRFELPAGSASFEIDGKRDSVISNRTSFVSESVGDD